MRLKLELAYFGGRAWLASRETGGAGAILKFERVRARRPGRFQPARSREITPHSRPDHSRIEALELRHRRSRRSCRRAVTLPERRRFVCLTFDGAYKDLITTAYPVLRAMASPSTVYVPTAFPDGVGEACGWRSRPSSPRKAVLP